MLNDGLPSIGWKELLAKWRLISSYEYFIVNKMSGQDDFGRSNGPNFGSERIGSDQMNWKGVAVCHLRTTIEMQSTMLSLCSNVVREGCWLQQ